MRLRPGEFAVALITAATVVVVGVEQGIILAIVLSVIVVLAHVYKPHDRIISFKADGSAVFGSVTAPVEAAPGLVIYAFGAELFYANASRFTEEIVAILESARTPIKWFAIDAAAMGDIDYSGADAMRQINKAVTEHGAKLVLSNVDTPVRKLLDAYGLTDLIGASADLPGCLERARRVPSVRRGSWRVSDGSGTGLTLRRGGSTNVVGTEARRKRGSNPR